MTTHQPAAGHRWHFTEKEHPRKDSRVVWIEPDGSETHGTFAGGAVWFPSGCGMYIYYTPKVWRYEDE